MLHDDGSEVQVYHVADGLSKGLRMCRNQSSFQEHEHGSVRHSRTAKNSQGRCRGLPMTKCRKRITREDTGHGTNLWRVSPVLSRGEN